MTPEDRAKQLYAEWASTPQAEQFFEGMGRKVEQTRARFTPGPPTRPAAPPEPWRPSVDEWDLLPDA
jgi:hypothetical protein